MCGETDCARYLDSNTNQNFVESKNLIKKESSSDDTFIEYVYNLNEDSNIVVTSVNELNQVGIKTIKLFHL